MKKYLLIFTLSIFALTSFSQTPQSRATLKTAPYSLINGQVPKNTTSLKALDNFLQSYWNTTDDGTPLINTTGWTLSGNALGANNKFIGSTDNRSLIIKTNNVQVAKYDSLGNYFLTPNTNTASPISGYKDGQMWFNNAGANGGGSGFTFYRPYSATNDVYHTTWTEGNTRGVLYFSKSDSGFWMGTKTKNSYNIFVNDGNPSIRVDRNGRIGLGAFSSTYTPVVTIGAGSASNTAIQLTAQTAYTGTTGGSIWYDGTGFNQRASRFMYTTPNANSNFIFQPYPSDVYSALYMGEGAATSTAPTTTNYSLLEYAGITYLNNGGSGKALNMLVNHAVKLQIVGTFTTGNHYAFEYFPNNHTNITAGAVNFAYLLRGASKTWTTGAIAIQKEFELQAPTWGAVAGSTMTTGYNMFVRQPTTGSNMSITNKFSLGCEGNVQIAGSLQLGVSTGSPAYNLDVTGNGRFTSTVTVGALAGTTTNDNTSAGNVGEYASVLVASGSAVTFTTATAMNICTLSLTAGDWDLEGNINYVETGSTVTERVGGLTSTSATIPSDGTEIYNGVQSIVVTEKNGNAFPRKRISISGTTTVYLVGKVTFSAGTVTGYGGMTARRVR